MRQRVHVKDVSTGKGAAIVAGWSGCATSQWSHMACKEEESKRECLGSIALG